MKTQTHTASHLQKSDWILAAIANIVAVVFFFLLYWVFPYKPYSNMLYFLFMAIAGVVCAKKYSFYSFNTGFRNTLIWSLGGSALMISAYGLLRAIYSFVIDHPKLAAAIDTGQWGRFAAPWLRINRVFSVLGIVLVVFATEYFYRAYLQAFFEKAFENRLYALLLASILSGIRGIGGGRMAGPVDFLLAFIWGGIYIRGGLTAALVTHMVWDVFFVYFTP